MTTAREATAHLADLLGREHHALAEFLIALAGFDRERRWMELGYPSLFDFLRCELKLSAGAAQYRKTAAGLIQAYPAVEAALRSGDLCLSSVIELAKVIAPESAAEVVPRFFGKSARDAAFVAAALRPVENPPRRNFVVSSLPATAPCELPSGSEPCTSLAATDTAEPPTSAASLGAVAPPFEPVAMSASTDRGRRSSSTARSPPAARE